MTEKGGGEIQVRAEEPLLWPHDDDHQRQCEREGRSMQFERISGRREREGDGNCVGQQNEED